MKERLIYIFPSNTSFIRKDIDFLSRNFEVISQKLEWARKSSVIPSLLRQLIFIIRYLPKSSVVLVMFGGYWSFLPALFGKIFNKPVFIIPGGADCVSFPEYNYGSLRKPVLRKIIKWSYTFSDRLLPVSETLVSVDYNYDPKVKKTKQGYLSFFPQLRTPHTVIYNGFDANYWQSPGKNKDNLNFTTIAAVEDQTRFKVKGIDLVIDIAKHFPGSFFHLVGISKQFANSLGELPENIIIHGFMDSGELRELLGKSRFYLQLSISEGFPNALCEAMLCECIPIGSSVGAIPFIIRDTGMLVEHKNAELAAEKISSLISLSSKELNELGIKARQNIISRFPIDNREKAILGLFHDQI
jgi:glycosyltransferase involved in cell wall biosynthesis